MTLHQDPSYQNLSMKNSWFLVVDEHHYWQVECHIQDKENKFLIFKLCINIIVLLIFFEAKFSYGFIEL
jgi:predicted double-glycine peptidase